MASVRNLAIIVSIAALSMAVPAAAQTITVVELDAVYERGDKIVISGNVEPRVGDIPVTLQVKWGSNVIAVDQLDVSRDGSFATIINTDGDVWEEGQYSVQASYKEGVTARQSFELSLEPVEVGPETVEGTSTVDIGDGEEGSIAYTISGGTVTDMAISREALGLTVYVNPVSDGNISFTASRSYFDARSSGCEGSDEGFIVLVDGRQVDEPAGYTVERGESANTFSVGFFEGERRIEVVGTCVIPEFGAVVMVVLAVSIAAATVASARFARA